MPLFHKKFRIESARLKQWDYSRPGMYFVTICTCNRDHYFGEIVDGKLAPSEMGRIVDSYWRKISVHFPMARLDEYVIMPNHIHGIINIVETPFKGVSVGITAPTVNAGIPTIGIIINQLKRMCTLSIKKQGVSFGWQPRFHDHIIRDDRSLFRIRRYIRDNPGNWNCDSENHLNRELSEMQSIVQ